MDDNKGMYTVDDKLMTVFYFPHDTATMYSFRRIHFFT